jgi:ribonucleoside-diphosphate reductase alpha chain
MTGHAYRTSARIAEVTGPFAGYASERRRDAPRHAQAPAAADQIDAELVPEGMLSAAKQSWDEAIALGEQHGYRNAQAIGARSHRHDRSDDGLRHDRDRARAGARQDEEARRRRHDAVRQPDRAPRARELGYDAAQATTSSPTSQSTTRSRTRRTSRPSITRVPLRDGEQPIHYMGHVRMMAAAQPFISGAISKTVNMPEEATVEEVEQLFVESWRLGLKAVAIYRDNCKVAQPLSADKKKTAEAPEAEPAVLAGRRRSGSRSRVPR